MTVLVNRLAAEPEVPIDHLDRAVEHELVEARLLGDLAPRRLRGALSGIPNSCTSRESAESEPGRPARAGRPRRRRSFRAGREAGTCGPWSDDESFSRR